MSAVTVGAFALKLVIIVVMQVLQALFLGILQGLTEFIPVSSSGHLVLAEKLFEMDVSGFVFDATLNLGTVAALLVYFRRDIAALIKDVINGGPNRKLGLLLALATAPAVIAGLMLQNFTESTFRSAPVVAIALILVSLAMLVADKLSTRIKQLQHASYSDSLVIGIAQVLAFIPGVSRSGVTITAGMARGLKRGAAARFSFLLSIPVLGGGTLKVLSGSGARTEIASKPLLFAVGVIAAGVSGYLAIEFLLRYFKRHGLKLFAYYRIALAALVILITAF